MGEVIYTSYKIKSIDILNQLRRLRYELLKEGHGLILICHGTTVN